MSRLKAACSFTCGKREKNEDNFYFDGEILDSDTYCGTIYLKKHWYPGNYCFGIFDGLGGLRNGEGASGLAAEVLSGLVCQNRCINEERLAGYFDSIHKSIRELSERTGYKTGSTGVILYVPKSLNAVFGNVGDSSLHLFRDDALSCLSFEHTDRMLIEKLGIKGKAPELNQYLGMLGVAALNPYISTLRLRRRDRILMCSDGLSGTMAYGEMESICRSSAGAAECSEQLVSRALHNGSTDNITVIICDVV